MLSDCKPELELTCHNNRFGLQYNQLAAVHPTSGLKAIASVGPARLPAQSSLMLKLHAIFPTQSATKRFVIVGIGAGPAEPEIWGEAVPDGSQDLRQPMGKSARPVVKRQLPK